MAVSISSLVVVFAWLALSFQCLSLIFYQSYSLRLSLILARYNFLRASFFLFLSQFLFDWYNLSFWHLSNHCMSLCGFILNPKDILTFIIVFVTVNKKFKNVAITRLSFFFKISSRLEGLNNRNSYTHDFTQLKIGYIFLFTVHSALFDKLKCNEKFT